MSRLILASLMVWVTLSVNGVDLSTLTTAENFKCLKDQHNINFIVMRGYRSYASPDPNVIAVLKAAESAGIAVRDIYMFPCRGKSPVSQADELVTHMGSTSFGTVWIDVETNTSPGCSWSQSSGADNCAFLEELVQELVKKGKKVGIYASHYMWQTIFGSATACAKFSAHPLWYAHYDNVQSFSDFTEFAGWTKPYAKQYKGTTTLCNTGVDLNWHP